MNDENRLREMHDILVNELGVGTRPGRIHDRLKAIESRVSGLEGKINNGLSDQIQSNTREIKSLKSSWKSDSGRAVLDAELKGWKRIGYFAKYGVIPLIGILYILADLLRNHT